MPERKVLNSSGQRCYHELMTQLEVLYRYERHPSEAVMVALGKARDVYGVRRIKIDAESNTIRVEYDATRLNKSMVHQILRRTGIDLQEEISLIPPQPPAEAPAQTATASALAR
ncbi:MAG TPA: hypothetical protein VGT04_10310 [Acidobacteriaceae bacterium]|nr:hypothetical protein [Acidobacteriaceae bacterium]